MEPSKRVFALIIVLVVSFSVFRSMQGPNAERVLTTERAQEIYLALGGKADTLPMVAFVTSWCPHCRSLELWMRRQGFDYVAADIEKDQEAARYFVEIAGYGAGVPRTMIGPYVVVGDSPGEIQAARLQLFQESRRPNSAPQQPPGAPAYGAP